MNKTRRNIIIGAVILAILFLATSYITQRNIGGITEIIRSNFLIGIIIYFFLEIISIVVAPISTLPLLPVASNAFGIPITLLISITSWTIGSILAFFIGRRFGKKYVKELVSLEEAEEVEKIIPAERKFVAITLLKVVIPIDLLSYALGVFTQINYRTFILSSIGLIPSALYFTYLGTLPFLYQIAGLLIGLIAAISILIGAIGIKKFRRLIGLKLTK